jgi:hypothetical protein
MRKALLVYHLLLSRPCQLGLAHFAHEVVVEHMYRPASDWLQKIYNWCTSFAFYRRKMKHVLRNFLFWYSELNFPKNPQNRFATLALQRFCHQAPWQKGNIFKYRAH